MEIVYIINPAARNVYKIGHTQNLEKRLRALQVSHYDELSVCHTFETNSASKAEQLLHKIFQNKRLRGEWYSLDDFDIAFIKRIVGFDVSFIWEYAAIPHTPNRVKPVNLIISDISTKEGFVDMTITESQLLGFLQTAWRRQTNGENGLSRNYWTRKHRPRMKMPFYIAMIRILEDNNLIANRERARSGNLIIGPSQCMTFIKSNKDFHNA